jgi:hypothetical protein
MGWKDVLEHCALEGSRLAERRVRPREAGIMPDPTRALTVALAARPGVRGEPAAAQQSARVAAPTL